MMTFRAFKQLTRLEHTPFGLPFIGAAMLLARPFDWKGAIWVFPCFLLARVSGMAFNQLVDRHWDAKNPRTANRVIPKGEVTPRQASLIAWGSLLPFLLLALYVNFYTALLAPLAAALLVIYSYVKRFHASCHFVLGAIHWVAPIMAYAACKNGFSWASFCLGGAAFCLIAGTDIVYAIQDYHFDRQNRLFSLPSILGIDTSLNISLIAHILSLQFLLACGIFAQLHPFYYGLLSTAAGVYFLFHRQIRKSFETIPQAFFLCNFAISMATFLFILLGQL